MSHKAILAAACGALALLSFTGVSRAEERQAGGTTYAYQGHVEPTKSKYRSKRSTRVRGYVARRGGYSYSDADVINTYGGSRSLYGSVNTYRDPSVDLQSPAGPFDHGFFFDSGIGPRGGNSPYPR
jgi:hypothetical protein